jgi:hypothetical protein
MRFVEVQAPSPREVPMDRKRFRWLVMACATLAGCADVSPTAMRPEASDAASLAAVGGDIDAAAPLDDAAHRATLGLADAAAASALRSQILAIAAAVRAGDVTTARRALRTAQSTYETYDAKAPRSDASDRSVIELALADADAMLRQGTKK